MIWTRNGSLSPIGLEIDGRSIAAVQLRRTAAGWQLEHATLFARTSDPASHAPAAAPDPADIQRIGEVLVRQGFRGSRVVVAIPNDQLLTGELELPPMNSGAPLRQIARMELARMHKCEPDDLELDFWNLPPRSRAASAGANASTTAGELRTSGPTTVMAAACATAHSLPLLDAFEHAGWDVEALDVPCCAAVRACSPLIPSESATVVLCMNWTATTVTLVYRHVIVYQRSVPDAGLDRFRQTLIEQLGLSAEAADVMMLHESSVDAAPAGSAASGRSAFRRLLNAHLERIVQEVRASCGYLTHRYADAFPGEGRVLLAGQGAAISGIADDLAHSLQMQVGVVSPGHVVAIADRPASRITHCNSPALIIALGLAQHSLDNHQGEESSGPLARADERTHRTAVGSDL